jgi:hypothetical protein
VAVANREIILPTSSYHRRNPFECERDDLSTFIWTECLRYSKGLDTTTSCGSSTTRYIAATDPTDVLFVLAQPIYVKYQPSDLPELRKVSPSWGGTYAYPPTSSSAPSATPSSTTTPGAGGLSTGAKIAIGVVVPVVVLALVFIVCLVVYRRRSGTRARGVQERYDVRPPGMATAGEDMRGDIRA